MKIEAIKKTGKKYKLNLEDNSNILTYDDVIINNGLLFNLDIDNEKLNKINIETEYFDIYYKTINYITRKLRSEKEINIFMDKYTINDKTKKEIIKKLKELGLINDENFVKAYISDKIHLSTSGPIKIKKELLEHDIEETLIDEHLDKISVEIVEEKITKLINKKIKNNTKYSGFHLKQKIIAELSNLGFEGSMVVNIYDSLNTDNNVIVKEYEKLYKKLSMKYSDKELEWKVREKLYQKGFTVDEINSVLE